MSTPDIMNSTEKIQKIANIAPPAKAAASDVVDANALPSWLTKTYLEQCLRTHHGDDKLKILRWHVRAALGKGENYGGVLTRIRAEYQTGAGDSHTGHYVVKNSNDDDEYVRQTMEPYDIFNREMTIYEQVLPKLNALLCEIGDNDQLFAETMAVDRERSALIFEDLNVRDFVMPDRLKGLDMPLIKLVLRKLAKMHATTAVLNEHESGSLETYDRGFFNHHTENYAPGFLGLLEACTRLVNGWNDYKYYGEKLGKLKPRYMELCRRVFDPTNGHVNVLAHGDLWTNNIMVKYDKKTGEPLDLIIIDFQYAAWGSPAIDLFYLFNTSLPEELHVHRQDELIQYYYHVLADTLRKLTYQAPIPSLHSFHMQLEEKAFYAFSSTCVVQPVQRLEETDEADFKAIMQDDERATRFKDACYRNPYCQRIIRRLLPVYERRGLLELDQ